MAQQRCNSGRWIGSGLSGSVKYLQDWDQMVRHDQTPDNLSSLIRIRLCRESNPKSVLGLTARCMTRLQGGVFKEIYSRQTTLAGFLGEMPFGEFLAAGDHGVGSSSICR
jgi:hypothetical protein